MTGGTWGKHPSADADPTSTEELAGAPQLAVGGEGIPLVGDVLVVNEVTEPAEGTRAVDRSIQPVTKTCLPLPLGEVDHVLPSVPRADPIEPEPTVGILFHIDGGILPDDRRIRGGIVVHLTRV